MTDEEAITVAMLHGCEFGHDGVAGSRWYSAEATAPRDPVEDLNFKTTGWSGFTSREELARAYCKFHNLEG